MKYTKEDGILTAEEAKTRSKNGQEDSMVRESIRSAMADIREKSCYGYRITTNWIHIRNDKEFKKIKDEIQKLGFKVKLKDTEKTPTPDRFNYIVDIQW